MSPWIRAGFAAFAAALLSGCAGDPVRESEKDDSIRRDLILDFGGGDAIRLVGMADNFDCDDPEHAEVGKVETFTLLFADGTTRRLCTPDPGQGGR